MVRRLTRCISLAAAGLLLAMAAAVPVHAAQTINVDQLTDDVDASAANGTCETPCSLRAAIQTANGAGSPGLDTLSLGAHDYQLSIAGGNEDASATGDLDITSDIDITGAGVASTSINGGDLDRVLDVRSNTVNISGLTITNGFAAFLPAPQDTFGGSGGGLRTNGASVVNVTDSAISDNAVHARGHGGGAATFDTSTLTLTRTSVASNEASETPSGGGGGVSEESPGSTARIVDSTVTGNHATFAAGVWDDGTGTVEITRSTVSGNSTVPDPSFGSLQSGGGVVEGAGTVRIADSVISNNTATYGAGVIDEGGTLTITNSTISGNHAQAVAGNTPPGSTFPFSNGVGAGLLGYGGGTITVTGTTLSGNVADLNGAAIAFQPFSSTNPVQFVNSTISNNSAGTAGGAARLDGGTNLTFTNTTIDANTAPIGANLNICSGGPALPGGYCDSTGASTITLRNSIVSGGSSANCSKTVGAFVSAGNNLDSGTSCGFGAGGDKNGANPLLAGLAANGGLTQTKALLDGSPAIDAALGCPATDQRGVARPFGAGCDMGAYEGGRPAVAAAAIPQCGDKRDNDGDGAIDLQDPGCKNGADGNEGDESLQDLVLCGKRQISLVRADAKGRRVVLSGLVSQANNGKSVQVFANYSTKKKAKGGRFTRLATVRASAKNGQFTARLKRPPARLFNKARFFARVGKARSVALKLPQSLASSSVRKVGSNIELRGTVKRSVLGKRNAIVVRRIVCGRYQTAGTAKPSKRGRYVVRFPAPKVGAAALYRAETRVLARPRSKRYVKQFARALGITLAG